MSGQYEFGMEKVLTFRRIQKELEVTTLSQAEGSLARLQHELRDCRVRIQRLEDELTSENPNSEVDIHRVIINKSFIRCLREEEKRLLYGVAVQEKEVDCRRTAVTERARDQKILERLKKKEQKTFEYDRKRREAGEMDEMILLRGGRLVPEF